MLEIAGEMQAGSRAPEDREMALPSGLRLATRVWRPAAEGRYPVLLMRQPYGREIASTVTLAHPSWYAAQGYVVAVQDVRGMGGSEGTWETLAHEAEDGAAAARWARALPEGDGRLGLYGFSYQAMTQYLALAGGAEADAMVPVMAPWDTWGDMAAEGGAFRLAWNVGWACQMAALAARQAHDPAAFEALRAAAAAPPVDGERPALPEVAGLARHGHLADWVGAIGDAAFWRARSPARLADDHPAALATPALTVGGWFDPFLTGSVAAHAAMAAAGAPARLVIGPWAHLVWQGGETSVDRLAVQWFDRFLKGARTGAEDGPPLRLYDLTRAEWRGFDAWPAETRRFWLAGDGLAAAGSTGALLGERPRGRSAETWVHDPWRPVPARGLHLAPPFGMAERQDLDARADVAVFTSGPLAAPLRLAGGGMLSLGLAADAPALDLHAVLSAVAPDGAARSLTSGHLRAAPGALSLALRPVAATVEPGARLRLSLSGAAWPAFAVNPGTGASPETTPAAARRPITLTVATPATLDLRVAP